MLNRLAQDGPPITLIDEEFTAPDAYKTGFMTKLAQDQRCPYVSIELVGHKVKARLDTGSMISVLSRRLAEAIMKSENWAELVKQNEAEFDDQIITKALNCNGDPVKIIGIIKLPTMKIGNIDLKVKCSFWIMESPTNDVLIANNWMRPIQGALAWKGDGQVLYFKLPTENLDAGGKPVKNTDVKILKRA